MLALLWPDTSSIGGLQTSRGGDDLDVPPKNWVAGGRHPGDGRRKGLRQVQFKALKTTARAPGLSPGGIQLVRLIIAVALPKTRWRTDRRLLT
jgi:hypothetical protein